MRKASRRASCQPAMCAVESGSTLDDRGANDSGDTKETGPFKAKDYGRAEVVFVCLGPKARDAEGAVGMLDALLARDLNATEKLARLGSKYGMMLTEPIRREVRHMEDYWDRVFREKYDEGKRDGERDGERNGRISNLAANARILTDYLAQPVDALLDLLRTSDEDRRAVHAILGE